MAIDTFVVLAASYGTLEAAETDYHAVHDFYLTSGLLDTYDAAVITRDDAGKVTIVAKHEQPTRQGAWRELGIGLVGGALVALFPAVGIGAGPLRGAAGGAGLGVLAGHVSAGLKRADLATQRDRLVLGQRAQMRDLDGAVGVLVDGQRVDHTDRVVGPQALQLGDDLPVELRMLEAEHDQLHRSDGHGGPLLAR